MRQQSLAHLFSDRGGMIEGESSTNFVSDQYTHDEKTLVTLVVLSIVSYSIFSEQSLLSEGWIYRLITFFLMNIIGIGLCLVSKRIVNSNQYFRYALYTLLIMKIAQFPMEKYFSLNLQNEKMWKHNVEYSNKILIPTVYKNVTFSKLQYEYKLGEIAKWYRIPIMNDTYLIDEDSLFYNSIPNDMNYCNYKASVESEWLEYLKAAKDMTEIPLNRMKILKNFNSTMSFKLYKSVSKVVNSIKSVHDLKLTKARLEQGISNECKGKYFKLIWWDFNRESIMNCTYIIKFSNTKEKNSFRTILDFERQHYLESSSERKYLENLHKSEYKWAASRRTIFDTEIFVTIQSKSVNENFEELLTPYSNRTIYPSSPIQCKEEQHTAYLGDFKILNETRFEWIHFYYPAQFYSGAIIASIAYLTVIVCQVLLVILFGYIVYQLFTFVDQEEEEAVPEDQYGEISEHYASSKDFSKDGGPILFERENAPHILLNNESNTIKLEETKEEEIFLIEVDPFEELRNSRKSRPNQSSDSISQEEDSDEEQLLTINMPLSTQLFSSEEVIQEQQTETQEQTNLLPRVTRRKNPSTKRSFALTVEAIQDVMLDEEPKELSPIQKKRKEE